MANLIKIAISLFCSLQILLIRCSSADDPNSNSSTIIPACSLSTGASLINLDESKIKQISSEVGNLPKLKLSLLFSVKYDSFFVQNNGFEMTFQFEEKIESSNVKISNDRWSSDDEYALAFGVFLWGLLDEDDDDLEVENGTNRLGGGSQHLINGDRYIAELQLVHFNKKHGTMEKAKDKQDGILVVCILFEAIGKVNEELQQLLKGFSNFVALPQSLVKPVHGPITIKEFFPTTRIAGYFEYNAPVHFGLICTSTLAKWIVLEEPSYVSLDQIGGLRLILDHKNTPYGQRRNGMSNIKEPSGGVKYYGNEIVMEESEDVQDETYNGAKNCYNAFDKLVLLSSVLILLLLLYT